MSKAIMETLSAMVESQPDDIQESVLSKAREVIEEARMDDEWDRVIASTTGGLDLLGAEIEAEMKAGLAEPFDYGRL